MEGVLDRVRDQLVHRQPGRSDRRIGQRPDFATGAEADPDAVRLGHRLQPLAHLAEQRGEILPALLNQSGACMDQHAHPVGDLGQRLPRARFVRSAGRELEQADHHLEVVAAAVIGLPHGRVACRVHGPATHKPFTFLNRFHGIEG